jgi:hypothetical protein
MVLYVTITQTHRQAFFNFSFACRASCSGEKDEALHLLEKCNEERGIQLGGNTDSLAKNRKWRFFRELPIHGLFPRRIPRRERPSPACLSVLLAHRSHWGD